MIPDGFNVDVFDTLDSTQNTALDRLKSALDLTRVPAAHAQTPSQIAGTVIMAHVQTNGRGRQGRVWENKSGNLAVTLIWPFTPGKAPGDYSLIVAVALADAVASFFPPLGDLTIKWPNDVLVAGRKICGILIEQPEPGWLLIGTGVNIAHAPDGRARLADFCNDIPSPQAVLGRYLTKFKEWVAVYNRDGLASICAAWMARAYGIGDPMTVRLPRESFLAVFRGIDLVDGACRAELLDGTIRRVHSGEVFF